MSTDAEIGYGAILKLGLGDTPETFLEIGEVTGVNGATATRDANDVTHMRSPNKFREYKAGLADPGELPFTVNYVPGSPSDLAMKEAFRTGRTANWQLVWEQFPGQPVLNLQGFIQSFPTVPNAAVGDVVTADITIKISGYPEYEDD